MESLFSLIRILFLVFLFFFTAFFVVYRRAAVELTDSIMKDSTRFVQRSSQEISAAFLREWQLMTESSFVNEIRNQLQYTDGSPMRYSRLLQQRKTLLKRFSQNSPFFHDIAVVHLTDKGDSLCSLYFIADDLRSNWDKALYRFGSLDYDQYTRMLESSSEYRFKPRMLMVDRLSHTYANSYSGYVGHYVYRVTPPSVKEPIYIVMQFDMEGLRKALSSFQYAGNKFIVSSMDEVLYTTDEGIHPSQFELKGHGVYFDGVSDTVYLQADLSNLGLICYISIDESNMYESIDNFRALLEVFSYVFVALTVMIIVLLFLRWHYPVIQVAQRISGIETQGRPIDSIDSHISNLVQKNSVQASLLQTLEPAAQNDLLMRFYMGRTLNEKERDLISRFIPLKEDGPFRCILLGCLDTPTAERSVLEKIWETLSCEMPFLYPHAYIDGKIVTLLPLEPSQEEAAHDSIDRLQAALGRINQESSHPCAMGISDIYMGLPSIPAAYVEAQLGWVDALNWQNASVVYIGNANESNASQMKYHLRFSQLEEMYYAISKGNCQLALAIFDDAVSKHFDSEAKQHLRQLYCQQFFSDVQGIITRLSSKYNILPVLDSMPMVGRQQPVLRQLSALRNALQECSELISRQSKGENSLLSQIQSFCMEQYNNPSFSLALVAEQFKLSESNLSKLFKNHTGINFSAYVENIRIRQAEKLLLEGRLSIKEVAVYVGYANSATFYNAFRRSHNCTPTQWIEMQAQVPDP